MNIWHLRIQVHFRDWFRRSEVLELFDEVDRVLGRVARLDGTQWILRESSIRDAIYLVAGETSADAERLVHNQFRTAANDDPELARLSIATSAALPAQG